MKQEFDKQLDSLLRGTRGGAAQARPAPASEHLSADELSAYAENALPPGARALYTAHLADCSDCRRIVSAVTLASGAEVVREASPADVAPVVLSAAASPSWRARLAALFSPRALAYVAPVLALMIVGALALVVLRSRREEGAPPNVAQQADSDAPRPGSAIQTAPPAATSETPAGTSADATLDAAGQDNASTVPNAGPARTEVGADDAPRPVTVPTQEAPSEEKAPSKDAFKELAAADAVVNNKAISEPQPPKPAAAEAPAASSPPAPPPATMATKAGPRPPADESVAAASRPAERDEDDEVAKQQRPVAENERGRGQRDLARGGGDPTRGRRMEQESREERRAASRRSRPEAAGQGESADDRKKMDSLAKAGSGSASETRRVAGHEFRREGGAWVDVQYRSSMSTVKVRRGSDSFRSLAADIPEVGRAAEQLPGTVIVVARGRAYRIN